MVPAATLPSPRANIAASFGGAYSTGTLEFGDVFGGFGERRRLGLRIVFGGEGRGSLAGRIGAVARYLAGAHDLRPPQLELVRRGRGSDGQDEEQRSLPDQLLRHRRALRHPLRRPDPFRPPPDSDLYLAGPL